MPTYEYRCTSCSTKFTVRHGRNDSVSICDKCGAGVVRTISVPFVIYKGNGFYSTDNASVTKQE